MSEHLGRDLRDLHAGWSWSPVLDGLTLFNSPLPPALGAYINSKRKWGDAISLQAGERETQRLGVKSRGFEGGVLAAFAFACVVRTD